MVWVMYMEPDKDKDKKHSKKFNEASNAETDNTENQNEEIVKLLESIDGRLEEQNEKLEEMASALRGIRSQTNILG